jgi:hypothetical protein
MLVGVAGVAGNPAAMANPLVAGFLSRPGFAEMTDGKPAGAFLPAAVAAAAKGGGDVDWRALPQKRLIDQVRQDMPDFCAVGIYQTPERVGFAKFSDPFYRDQRFAVATTQAGQPRITAAKSFATLADDKSLKLGGIDGFSYGVAIDALVKGMVGHVDLAVITPDKLLAKLAAGRIAGELEVFLDRIRAA